MVSWYRMKSVQLVVVAAFIFPHMKMGDSQCDVVRLAAAVHETLSPFMTEMKEDLAAVRETLSSLNETVSDLSRDLEEVKNQSKPQVLEELVLQGILPLINNLEQNLQEIVVNITQESQVITQESQNTTVDLTPQVYECGGTEGWRRVVYLNMTDPNTNCPSGWQLTSHSKRTCGRVSTSHLSCDSVFFSVSGGDYTSVCGAIRAYQNGHTDAFQAYHEGRVTTIEGAYVTGVSLTHGSPRQHIWAFAAGGDEDRPTRIDACPCDAGISIIIPPFVGGDYFCESGVNSGSTMGFHPDDPLWDGEGCSSSSSCCSFNNPPYFTKQLPSPTSDPIEARLCRWERSDDSPVEFMELYVK